MMIKNTILFVALATFLNVEAHSLNVRNSGEATQIYLHTNIGGTHNEDLFTAKAHTTTSQSIITQLGDLKADLNAGEKGEFKFCFIDKNNQEKCGKLHALTKETTVNALQAIDAKTIDITRGFEGE